MCNQMSEMQEELGSQQRSVEVLRRDVDDIYAKLSDCATIGEVDDLRAMESRLEDRFQADLSEIRQTKADREVVDRLAARESVERLTTMELALQQQRLGTIENRCRQLSEGMVDTRSQLQDFLGLFVSKMSKRRLGGRLASPHALLRVTLTSWRQYVSAVGEARARGKDAYAAIVQGDAPIADASTLERARLSAKISAVALQQPGSQTAGETAVGDGVEAFPTGGDGAGVAEQGGRSADADNPRAHGKLAYVRRWFDGLDVELDETTRQLVALRSDYARVCIEKADLSLMLEQAEVVNQLVVKETNNSSNLEAVSSRLQETIEASGVVESAIGEAFKIMQAQVLSKASRRELHDALSKALDSSLDSQDRLRAISSTLEHLEDEVQKRASSQHVAELQGVLSRMRILQDKGGVTKRSLEGSPYMPSFCLVCNQEMPLEKNASTTPMVPQVKSANQQAGAPFLNASSRARLLYGRGDAESPQRPQSSQTYRSASLKALEPGTTVNGSELQPIRPAQGPPAAGLRRVRPGSAPFKPASPGMLRSRSVHEV